MLTKDVTYPTGVVATLHRVMSVTVRFALDGSASTAIVFHSFVNKDVLFPVGNETVTIPSAPDGDLLAWAEAQIIASHDELSLATSVATEIPASLQAADAAPAIASQ